VVLASWRPSAVQRLTVPCVARAGYIFPGGTWTVDQAGWQCVAPDPAEDRGRCRRAATHVQRRRDGHRVRQTALCQRHYQLAGPEAPAG
jgi:hypothetical protein